MVPPSLIPRGLKVCIKPVTIKVQTLTALKRQIGDVPDVTQIRRWGGKGPLARPSTLAFAGSGTVVRAVAGRAGGRCA